MAGGASDRCRAYCGGIDLGFELPRLLDSVRGYLARGFNGVKIKVSQLITADIISGLSGSKPFSLAQHAETVKEARSAYQTRARTLKETQLTAILDPLPPARQALLHRACKTGRFLSVTPSYSANSVLSTEEFRDRLHYRYGINPSNLPTHCDGCGAPFSVDHAMSCRKGGLVIARHNELRDDLGDLYCEAAGRGSSRDEPLIFPPLPPPKPRTPPLPPATSTGPPSPSTPHLPHPPPTPWAQRAFVRGGGYQGCLAPA